MSIWWWLLISLQLVIAVGTIVDVVGRRYGAGKTVAWVIIVLVLPLVGSAAYWIMRKPVEDDEARQAFLAQQEVRREAERRPFG